MPGGAGVATGPNRTFVRCAANDRNEAEANARWAPGRRDAANDVFGP
jgi:hypothetical protein